MSSVGTRKKGSRANLICGSYKQKGSTFCSSHSIDYDTLYNIVLEAIRQQISFTQEERKNLFKDMVKSKDVNTSKIDNAKKKLIGVSSKLTQLYDKKFSKDIDDATFEALRAKYVLEKESLEIIIAEEEKFLAINLDTKDLIKKHDKFKQLILDFENLSYLDSEIIFKLIERINVHHSVYINNVKHQQIDVYFKFGCEPSEITLQ